MTAFTFLVAAILLTSAYFFLKGYFRVWLTYRGERIIICPENHKSAAVLVDASRAAKWTAIAGKTPLSLSTCSRWPEMAGCGQECLAQVESSPAACAVKTIVTQWYEGKSCAFCGHAIEEIVWHERPPALRAPDGVTREWNEMATELLPSVFATHQAVCWPCHVRESFRYKHPELVIERPPHSEHHHVIPPSLSVY